MVAYGMTLSAPRQHLDTLVFGKKAESGRCNKVCDKIRLNICFACQACQLGSPIYPTKYHGFWPLPKVEYDCI